MDVNQACLFLETVNQGLSSTKRAYFRCRDTNFKTRKRDLGSPPVTNPRLCPPLRLRLHLHLDLGLGLHPVVTIRPRLPRPKQRSFFPKTGLAASEKRSPSQGRTRLNTRAPRRSNGAARDAESLDGSWQ